MSDGATGVGGLKYDKSKRKLPAEFNIFIALVVIIAIFEILGQTLPYMNGQSMFMDFNTARDGTIWNVARLKIVVLQVAIIGILALGVTQVIISGGIDLSSGPLLAATGMIVMSFAQTELVNGSPNPKALFGLWAMDLPIFIPIIVGIIFGGLMGAINGGVIAYFGIPPFIQTLGMFLFARGVAFWWSNGAPLSFPTESFKAIGSGMMPVVWFILLAILFHLIMRYTVYGKRTYAIGSNEDAARMSGINIKRHKVLVYAMAGMLTGAAAIILVSKGATAQTGNGQFYELFAISMAVIGGVSLTGGRGSIIGTVLGACVIGVIRSGFTFIKLDSYYQLMAMGMIIVGAAILDQWRRNRATR